jgi:hypothetical protein
VRSSEWASGRKESAVHSLRIGRIRAQVAALEARLPWVSMTPLGSPVVPLV